MTQKVLRPAQPSDHAERPVLETKGPRSAPTLACAPSLRSVGKQQPEPCPQVGRKRGGHPPAPRQGRKARLRRGRQPGTRRGAPRRLPGRGRPRGAGVQLTVSKRVWARVGRVRQSPWPTPPRTLYLSAFQAGPRSSASLMSSSPGARGQTRSGRARRPCPPRGPAPAPPRQGLAPGGLGRG